MVSHCKITTKIYALPYLFIFPISQFLQKRIKKTLNMQIEKHIPNKSEQFNNLLDFGDIITYLFPLVLFFIENQYLFIGTVIFSVFLIFVSIRKFKRGVKSYVFKIKIEDNRVQIHYLDNNELKVIEDFTSNISLGLFLTVNSSSNIEDVSLTVYFEDKSFDFLKRMTWKYSEIKAIFTTINDSCKYPLQEKEFYKVEELNRMIEVFEGKAK